MFTTKMNPKNNLGCLNVSIFVFVKIARQKIFASPYFPLFVISFVVLSQILFLWCSLVKIARHEKF